MSDIKALDKLREKSLKYAPGIRRGVNMALDEIEREIVRCRDCKRVSVDEFGGGWCKENCREVKPWDFCAWAEWRGE